MNDAVKERMKGTFSRPMGEDRYGKTYGVDQSCLDKDQMAEAAF
jgi:hypothetical protein